MATPPAHIRKLGDRVTEIRATFPVPRERLFAALTQPAQLLGWMSATGFALDAVDVDGRSGGSFRYVYRRTSGRTIEVRGEYRRFDPPRGFAYEESYDFSPLRIDVEVALEEDGDATRYTQTLRYAASAERDGDFEGVAASSREALAKLARHLAGRPASAGE